MTKDRFGAESLERPALVHTPEGRWRLYVSCATPGTKHWWVDVLEADTPEGLADGAAPDGAARAATPHAVKDPVIRRGGRHRGTSGPRCTRSTSRGTRTG